jgi:A/G-specific adenine glycosylase
MEPSKQAKRLDGMAELLLSWYDRNKRDLPWRENRDPYRIWVSEIMLQQTRAETVKPYFLRFVDRLPTVRALAEAEESELLKLWEGLGYYSRVRNLQKAARTVMSEHGGVIPADFDALLALSGVGRYTAGAIASMAFDISVPAVDGNVLRVMARLMKYEENVLSPATRSYVEDVVSHLVPTVRAGDFNQALIELGALVCLPSGEAKCASCPLALLCAAHRDGADTVARLPVRIKNTTRRIEQRTVLIIIDEMGHVAVRRRPDQGLLGGLYEFPNVEGSLTPTDVTIHLQAEGLTVAHEPVRLSDARHLFSHIEWQMCGYAVRVSRPSSVDTFCFASKAELDEQYAIPSAFSVYRKWVDEMTDDAFCKKTLHP